MKLFSVLYKDWHPFNTFYPEAECVVITQPSELTGAGILILWGGEDINPKLYNRPNIRTNSHQVSKRDAMETSLFLAAVAKQMPIIGVCRGAQLACALSGGVLVQDVDGHNVQHYIRTSDGRRLLSSSIHHQMMYPWGCEGDLLAWSDPPKSMVYDGLTKEEAGLMTKEPEIFYFKKTHCLAIQGHPEYMEASCPFNSYVGELCTTYMS